MNKLFDTTVLVTDDLISRDNAEVIRAYILYRDKQEYLHEDMFTDPQTEILCPPLVGLRSVFVDLFHTLLREYQPDAPTSAIQLSTCKYNLMRAGERRPIHMHHKIDAYAVLYLDNHITGEGGELVLHDPKFTDSPFSHNRYHLIQPQVGRVVVAPSYVWHEVNTYYGPSPRVAVVVNCTVADK